MKSAAKTDLFITLGIILVVIGLCGLTSGGHVYVRDGAAMYFMSSSIADHQWFDVIIHPNTVGGMYGPDGRYYMPFGILQPLLAVPFLLLGRQLAVLYETQYLSFFCITWFNWLVTASLAGAVYLIFRHFEVNKIYSLIMGFSVVFSTPFWIYSQTFFTEPVTSLFGLLSWFLMHYGLTKNKKVYLFLSGAFAGAIMLIRPLGGLILPPLILFFLLRRNGGSKVVKPLGNVCFELVAFLVPAGSGIAGYLIYNFIRFGSFLETGYDKLPSGLPRNFTLDFFSGLNILLFSPGKSIFLFAPLILPATIGLIIWLTNKTHFPEALFSLATAVLYIVTLSQWSRVEGGVSWGPRLLLPAIPILFLGIIPLLRRSTRLVQSGLIILILIGILIQIPGIFVNFSTQIDRYSYTYFSPKDGNYLFDFNPFPIHINELNELLRNLPKSRQHAEEIARINRSFEQINPDGILDVWWMQMWADRVPVSFIKTLLMILIGLIILGSAVIFWGFHLNRRLNRKC